MIKYIAFPIRVRYKNLGLWEWGMGNWELKKYFTCSQAYFFPHIHFLYSLFPIPHSRTEKMPIAVPHKSEKRYSRFNAIIS